MDKIIDTYNALTLSKFREKLSTLSTEDMIKLKKNFDNRYYNTGQHTIDDMKYDVFCEALHERDEKLVSQVGCKLRTGDNATKLPIYLTGMDKIKKGDVVKLDKWGRNNPCDTVVLSDKLNGVSCLVVYTSNRIKLYTRGDGIEGADISYLSDKIKGIPKFKKECMVRGEIIITTEHFNLYKDDYTNSLGLIVGIVNSKTHREPIKHLEFVAYELIDADTPEKNLKTLSAYGFNVVNHTVIKKQDLTMETLSDYLQKRKETSVYDIDGIVVYNNTKYVRVQSKNPEYAFAFKMIIEVAEVIVDDVIWETSRWGILKPRIKIIPRQLTNITITFMTGFNALYIKTNKINKGSKLLITRSGDIIPYILEVLTHSETPKMPDTDYVWNESGVDILIVNKDDVFVIKQLVHFFVCMNIENINEGVVKKLVEYGFTTIEDILKASVEDFRKIPSYKGKMCEKIYENIHSKLVHVKIPDLMCGSSIFEIGMGKKKATVLWNAIPTLLTHKVEIDDIQRVDGFSTKTAEKVIRNLQEFKTFHKDMSKYMTFESVNEKVVVGNKYKDQKYVFSGFRDKELEEYISSNGGSISTSVSSKTTAVIISEEETSGKITKAKELGIKIIKVDDFKEGF